MVESSENLVPTGLLIIGKLYEEKRIDDTARDELKNMLFSEDSTLIALLGAYDQESQQDELKDAIERYSNQGKMAAMNDQGDDDMDGMTSPTDTAIDMMKKKRLYLLKNAGKEDKSSKPSGITINEADLGASP